MKESRFAVIGLGRFGSLLVRALSEEGMEVIAVDRNQHAVEAVKDYATVAVAFDSTNREALLEHGINEVDVAVVGIGENFEANLFTSLLLKKTGTARVIARAMTSLQADILRGIGVDEVVSPEEESARRLARTLSRPNLLDFIEIAAEHVIVQVKAPQRFAGKSILDLEIRRKYNVNLVAIKRHKGGIVGVPRAEDVIEENDVMVIVGREKDIARMTN